MQPEIAVDFAGWKKDDATARFAPFWPHTVMGKNRPNARAEVSF
jgi:hypothetical protein